MTTTAIPPRNFHIFGSGISFSISPTIHNTGFRYYGLPYTYDIRESPSIDEVAWLIQDPRFGGASVTMPHKLQVHKYCNHQTETARLIGAINTLIVKSDGDRQIITGDNTDWSGLHSIIANYSAKTQQQPNVGLVIGAGGAARAALFALHKAGIQHIYVVNRTLSVAEKVKHDFKNVFDITVLPSLGELSNNPDVIIGTVPAETTTEDQFSSLFGPQGLCIDMSYKPRQTPLLNAAQKHPEWTTVPGVEVLLAQGFDQFRLWTGRDLPKEKMVEAVMARDRELIKGPKNGML
ncbi:shikimate / quinate 5-dehydrogenase protein [Penicillium alfredii]|uniref:Shikimate / quinate 5-dehydrogenase protein n=1 Tax=Penicillium alfredii TaxID=1506179 RepID=A0A9W9FAF0_9EURO|nr:shikimate / quinate 5-dehydrogenase protein [Penicillium alfredii]KAJ5096352.1 shikimate / quinate 5-dehydrogenase protein [Penicillium alfredii]